MRDLPDVLDDVALVTANFGDGPALRDVLNDWFAFMGGRPGEVVVLDNGSDVATRDASRDCFDDGLIDKLLMVRPGHPDTPKERAHLAEHTAPAIALKPYLLFYKFDTLPFRQGHDHWLAEAVGHLDRPDTFAMGGSFNLPSEHHDGPWPGWYFSDKCSENFTLIKRDMFIAAMEEFAGTYISSGFRAPNPAATTGQDRFLIEVAWERYIANHQRYTLVRREDPTWTIFHTNVHNEDLKTTRERYQRREDIHRYLNAARVTSIPGATYYGQPIPGKLAELRYHFGQSRAGAIWRAMKNRLRGGRRTA